MRHYYKHLLESIEKGEIQIFEEILEKNLQFCLYSDLKKMYEKNYSIKLLNPKEPIFLKILSINEMPNVNVDRDKNPEINEKDIIYSLSGGGNKIYINQNDPDFENKLQGKTYIDITREKEVFNKSEFKNLTYDHLKREAKYLYGIEYAKNKMGSKFNEKNIQQISNLIEQLENSVKNDDPYAIEIKNQFADYHLGRQSFIDDKLKTTDLYEYFKLNLPSHFNQFLDQYESNMSLIQRLLYNIRKRFNKKYSSRSKQISSNKTLIVIDVEFTSKMRLEILDENENNILESVYSYKDRIKRKLNDTHFKNSLENNESKYDSNIYKLNTPDRKWNYLNPDFMQSHIFRFEFEKKNKFRNIFRHPYNSLLITDIDLCLKGNKHFKFNKNYI
jgi:hypothetical protein